MLVQTSYYKKETEQLIDATVGKPFGIWNTLKMGGIGSQRFAVLEANQELSDLLEQQNSTSTTNIELRPRGIILWFRVKIDNWVLVLPYSTLNITVNSNDLIVHSDQWNIKLNPAHNLRLNLKFIHKLLSFKDASPDLMGN